MPFEPGNQHGAIPKPEAVERRKRSRSLAMVLREYPVEQIRDWLVGVWREGRDPATGEVVRMADRMTALKVFLERAYGQAAQHVVLEGEIRSEVVSIAPRDARPKMTLDEINERRASLRAQGFRPKIVDAESREMPAAPALALAPVADEDE